MKTALLLLAAALISAPAAAHEPVVAVGVGTNSCAEFTALIHHSKRQADNPYYSWAEGFWRLANMGRMANKNKFKDLITAPQARGQIVNYCNFHPGDAFYQAVMDVYDGFLDADP
jgi:hypothetical protein